MVDHSSFLFINAEGDMSESSVGDSLKYASFKTANNELTDALLGKLVNAINTSAGPTDQGKFINLDANGKVSSTMINTGGIDHGDLDAGSLGDDDHPHYILADGTRAFSNPVSGVAATSSSELVTKAQLDSVDQGRFHKDPVRVATAAALPSYTRTLNVLDADANGVLPDVDGVSLQNGDSLLLNHGGAGSDNGIYTVTDKGSLSTKWKLTRREDSDISDEMKSGLTVVVEEGTENKDQWFMLTTNNPIVLNTTALSFNSMPHTTYTGSLGVKLSGADFQFDYLSGGGLKLAGNQARVEPGDFAGEGLKDDGSDNMAIDWSVTFDDSKAIKASDLNSVSAGRGASLIGVQDAAGKLNSDDVEAALEEIYDIASASATNEISLTTTAAINKGDLIQVNGNDSCKKLDVTAAASPGAVGIAKNSYAISTLADLVQDGEIIKNVLTAASAGAKVYWSGTALTTSMPSTSGSHVFQVGRAINATDLYINIEYIKKNA